MIYKHNIRVKYFKKNKKIIIPEIQQILPVASCLADILIKNHSTSTGGLSNAFMRLDSIVPIWRSGVVKLLLCRRGHSYAFGLPPPFIGPFSIFSTTQAEQRHTAMQLSSIEE